MAEQRIIDILKNWQRAEGVKSQHHHHFDDLARVMLPGKLGFATTVIEGQRRTDEIFDGTPMQEARSLANAIGGMVRPQGLPEVKMKAEDDSLNAQGEVQDWFGGSEERLEEKFDNPHARFREASGEKDLDIVVFGTAVVFVGESAKSRDRLLFMGIHLKDATILFDEEQSPETVYRRRRMPLRHMEDRFGLEKLSSESQTKIKDNADQKITVLHAVLPRKKGRPDALFAKDLPIAEMWIEVESKHLLLEGGYHEFPYIVPRWDTSSGEDMGRSPGMIALPDADTLQAMGETILMAGQRAADPPLAVPNDGSFDAINTFPGGLAYYDVETAIALRGNPFFTIPSGTNIPISRDMQLDTREQIRRAFFKNVLNLPIEGPQMTATEVIQRKEEFIREMGPIFGRLESSDTAPTVERGFMIVLRSGGFGQIPQQLQGQNIRFEYDSPVKRIRQQVEAASARLWAGERMELAAAEQGLGMDPKSADLVNTDALGRLSAEALGLPDQVVNDEGVVEEIRESRRQQAAAQAQLVAAQQMAELVKAGTEAQSKFVESEQQGVK